MAAAAIIFALLWNVHAAHAALDPESEAALNRLTLQLRERPNSLDQGQMVLYQTLHNLWLLSEHHVGPTAALFLVRERAAGSFDPTPFIRRLEADFQVASQFGLFTPENLTRLQSGQSPVAKSVTSYTLPVKVVKIRPDALDYSLPNLALSLETSPAETKKVYAGQSSNPTMVYGTPPPQLVAADPSLAGKTIPLPAPRMAYGGGMIYPMAGRPNPPPPGSSPGAAPVEMHDLPFNEMLPIGGKIKLAIARANAQEVTVSVLGEREILKPSTLTTKGTYHPSVSSLVVPKKNPVRLPGIDANAYLVYKESPDRTAVEARWYFIDTTLNNGMTFRLAKVTGPF